MESQQVSSPVTGSGASARHRAVLLTGGAGVVGDALLTRLSNMKVVCLAHRTALTGHAK